VLIDAIENIAALKIPGDFPLANLLLKEFFWLNKVFVNLHVHAIKPLALDFPLETSRFL
jgi:hypothetical protein